MRIVVGIPEGLGKCGFLENTDIFKRVFLNFAIFNCERFQRESK